MSRITFNSNLQALQAERRLGQSTRSLEGSLERLSSGLRINTAGDDAAGLAIADTLRTDSRVLTQAIRNANDGISLLAIAEGAANSLSTIVLRLQELAEQSANGTLSSTQRTALDEEAQALRDEFNRITESTEFNDINLLDSTLENLAVQVGYGTDGSIAYSTGEALANVVADGFSDDAAKALGTESTGIVAGDFDGDGDNDYIIAANGSDTSFISLNDGQGGFTDGGSFSNPSGSNNASSIAFDIDNDGDLDYVVGDDTKGFNIFTNDGSGTFTSTTFEVGVGVTDELVARDMNNDGLTDIVFVDIDGNLSIAENTGNTTFSSQFVGVLKSVNFDVGDVNGDGNLDIIAAETGDVDLEILLGDGALNFSSSFTTTFAGGVDIQVADVNLDGFDDYVTFRAGDGVILTSNGDGTFTQTSTFVTKAGADSFLLTDINEDGYADIVDYQADSISTLLNDGTGAMDPEFEFLNGFTQGDNMRVADFNGDGALDFLVGSTSQDSIAYSNTNTDTSLSAFTLKTQNSARAALNLFTEVQERVSSELGILGSITSRLTATLSNLQQVKENYLTAESQIRDVDVASETANLVRNQILQQAGTSVLSQANVLPELALRLIGGAGEN